MKDVLIVFAKYPTPGRCKTRLIPALGAEGAANLQRQMTFHTLAWCRRFALQQPAALQVHFADSNEPQMEQTYGSGLAYHRQTDGDLGQRMQAAVQAALDQGAQRVVVVGTDCPQIEVEHAANAFERLESHAVCFTPARDGGYVLVGVSARCLAAQPQLLPTLFGGIDWGTHRVLAQSIQQVVASGASLSLLPTLADVDRPADLTVWDAAVANKPREQPRLSIVIPTYDAESDLPDVLERAARDPAVEILVVAAGNAESSAHSAARHGAQFLMTGAGRGAQMNRGAAIAQADTLLFLHADTLLPVDYRACIDNSLSASNVVAGAFTLRIDSPRLAARWVERGVALRCKYRQLPYGDQGLFLSAQRFEQLGGFASMPIMEDYEFVRRACRLGRIATCDAAVTTSPRRWHRLGIFRTTLLNQCMLAGYHLGVSPQRLADFYRRR